MSVRCKKQKHLHYNCKDKYNTKHVTNKYGSLFVGAHIGINPGMLA